jgi:transposase
MEHKTLSRRRHSKELKVKVLDACQQPGASVAAIALAHGLNANLVHKWQRNVARATSTAGLSSIDGFVPLPMESAALPLPDADIRIELRRGAVTMNVSWPMGAASECAHWQGNCCDDPC